MLYLKLLLLAVQGCSKFPQICFQAHNIFFLKKEIPVEIMALRSISRQTCDLDQWYHLVWMCIFKVKECSLPIRPMIRMTKSLLLWEQPGCVPPLGDNFPLQGVCWRCQGLPLCANSIISNIYLQKHYTVFLKTFFFHLDMTPVCPDFKIHSGASITRLKTTACNAGILNSIWIASQLLHF